jgi:rubrerythrin
MALTYNAREIFEMGVRIEENGRAFYAAAAARPAPEGVRALLRELAEWEARHVALFESLRDGLPRQAGSAELHDPDGQAVAYLRAAADSHVFKPSADPAAAALRCKTPGEALAVALTFEKDSVVFYTAMKRVVPPELGQDTVDRLINEEMAHIAMISQRQKEIAGA